MVVRGNVPADLAEKISKAHSEAIKNQRRVAAKVAAAAATSPKKLTPSSNTGSETAMKPVLEAAVCVDYLRVTMPDGYGVLMTAASLALDYAVTDWTVLEHGGDRYAGGFAGPGGAKLYHSPIGREGKDAHLILPGKACAQAGYAGLQSLARIVLAHGGYATRVDVAADDYKRGMTMDEIKAHLRNKAERVTHAKKSRVVDEDDNGENSGYTVYLGQRTSRRYLRVYDKNLESNGEKNCIRWELVNQRELAQAVLALLGKTPVADYGKLVASLLTGYVDFRESQTVGHKERRVRSAWFVGLVGLVEAAKVYRVVMARTLEQVKTWLNRQVMPSLALVVKAAGGSVDELLGQISNAQWRLRPKHLAMLSAAGLGGSG